MGTLTVTDSGIAFEETGKDGKAPKHPKSWRWAYVDIQQLKISPKSLTVLTYKDNAWKFGADREYDFDLVSGKNFEDAYALLKARLDQRFVAAIAAPPASPLWEIPAKRLVRFGGNEGVLQVGAGEIVYKSVKNNESRTWRYEDIDNITSSGLFQLTITTFERAKLDYGSLKQFNFELKQRLEGQVQEVLKQEKYAKLELVKIAYGDDLRDKSVSETEGLIQSYPDLKCIVAPTTVGIAAAAKVVTDQGLIGKLQITGLGLPSEMKDYITGGACPYMYLWNPIDLGYLGAYIVDAMATGKITGAEGDTFNANRLGDYTVTAAADGGTEVLLGPPFKFDPSNIGEWGSVY
jgi:ABC-type sugar transport system substrate-binding protein